MRLHNLRTIACLAALATGISACESITTENERDESSVPMADIIAVDASVSSLPADGSSTTRVSAHIPAGASAKTVTFTTTAGVFLESATKEVKVFAAQDASNSGKRVASTLLRSDTVAARAIIRATVGDYYDTVSVTFTKP